ncbi:hypothetical protein QTP88_024228 [Uroleucon formosanum]
MLKSWTPSLKLFKLVKQRYYLSNLHGIDIELENIHFFDISEFDSWKCEMKQQTSTMYILNKAASKFSDENINQFYYCHHSYSYRKEGNNVREIKSLGSKID